MKDYKTYQNALLITLVALIVVYMPRLVLDSYAVDDYLLMDGSRLADFFLVSNARWVQFLVHYFVLKDEFIVYPYANGILTLILLALSGLLTAHLFRLQKPLFVMLIAMLPGVSPYFADNSSYTTNFPTIGIACFFAVFAAYCFLDVKRPYGYLLGFLSTLVLVGAYQSLVQPLLALLVIRWFMDVADANESFDFAFLKKGLINIGLSVICILIAIFISLKIAAYLSHIFVAPELIAEKGARVSAAAAQGLNVVSLWNHFLEKTQGTRSQLGGLLYIAPVVAVLLFFALIYTLLNQKVSFDAKKAVLKWTVAFMILVASIGFVIAYPRGYLVFQGSILVVSYVIIVGGAVTLAWRLVEKIQKINWCSLFVLAAVVLFVGVLPLIVHLPLLLGQSLSVRSHFSMVWLVAGGFSFFVLYGKHKAKKFAIGILSLLLFLSGFYALKLHQIRHLHAEIDIASALTLVSMIRNSEGYEKVREPINLKIVGGRVPTDILMPESEEPLPAAFSTAYSWSQYNLLRYRTDLYFNKIDDERWDNKYKDKYDNVEMPIYPSKGSIVVEPEDNLVIVFFAAKDGEYAR